MWKSAVATGDCFVNKHGSEVGQGGQEGYCVTVCGGEVGQGGQEGYCVTVCGSEVGQGGQEG